MENSAPDPGTPVAAAPGIWSGSLSFRLFALTSLFAVVAIAVIALLLSQIYRVNAERRFEELLFANLYNLMGSAEIGEDGRLTGAPDLRDPRFARFQSGWNWSVTSLSDPSNRLVSQSLAGQTIPDPGDVAFDPGFQRRYSYQDASGQRISVVEGQVIMGRDNDIFSFRVTGNRDEIASETGGFTRQLVVLLGLFALGFIAASYGIVRLGLRPITRATRRLGDIRDGRADELDGRYPREIQPLIDEANSLIRSNRSVIERARTQVGNLAHSLKTPLAVLRNEARDAPPQLGRIIAEQTGLMQHQVENYLNRARIAARHGSVTARTPVRPVADRLVRVIARLNPGLSVSAACDDDLVFAGETQDLEEILGNLLENAARFATREVTLAVARDSAGPGGARLVFAVADDGPGMNAGEAEMALRRGTRLDESTPGSGLGLSIVKDITGEYGGDLVLDRAPSGGLRARVFLPGR